ncbi:MAG: magnesium transporter CorA family protein, partial [Tannerellaceae bacterium]|nr:magnesium transporter CorA family protein [Tannerellaceae bacterium]
MRSFLYSEATGFVEKDHWLANCWVKVETPTTDDIHYLINELQVPESFISDIEDTDERPRIEYEDNWLLTILRIPIIENNKSIPYSTVPIGIMTNGDVIVTVCYFQTEVIQDFIQYTRRKG